MVDSDGGGAGERVAVGGRQDPAVGDQGAGAQRTAWKFKTHVTKRYLMVNIDHNSMHRITLGSN